MTSTPLVWRRSTRSGDNQGNCVEAASWRKSTRSNGSGGQNCVEVGSCTCHGVAIRDSKLPTTGDFPTLSISRADWAALMTAIKTGSLR